MKKLAGAVNCRYLLSLLLSILFAFLIGAGILAVSGFHPLEAYGAMLSGAFDSARHIGDFLEYAMVLCVCGLACVLGARVGIFNVGGEGLRIINQNDDTSGRRIVREAENSLFQTIFVKREIFAFYLCGVFSGLFDGDADGGRSG